MVSWLVAVEARWPIGTFRLLEVIVVWRQGAKDITHVDRILVVPTIFVCFSEGHTFPVSFVIVKPDVQRVT